MKVGICCSPFIPSFADIHDLLRIGAEVLIKVCHAALRMQKPKVQVIHQIYW